MIQVYWRNSSNCGFEEGFTWDGSIVQEGSPSVIPLEACYIGRQQSLNNLAKLVEPDIPE